MNNVSFENSNVLLAMRVITLKCTISLRQLARLGAIKPDMPHRYFVLSTFYCLGSCSWPHPCSWDTPAANSPLAEPRDLTSPHLSFDEVGPSFCRMILHLTRPVLLIPKSERWTMSTSKTSSSSRRNVQSAACYRRSLSADDEPSQSFLPMMTCAASV